MLSCTGQICQARHAAGGDERDESGHQPSRPRARANRRSNRRPRLRQVDRAEIDAEILERLVALIRVLGQRAPEDVLESFAADP